MKKTGRSQKSDEVGVKLEEILDKTHGLYQLANRLNWDYLIESCGAYYSEAGRPGVPIRVMAGLHYLKYLENESDESIVPADEFSGIGLHQS